jgi:2-keto-4-pentenoate hydratase/2-oxohepta-3-ene-1,7-dioic acid hydratase in catechol pathway
MIELPIIGRSYSYTLHPTKLIALGHNYREHIGESVSKDTQDDTDVEIPKEPILFPKTPNVLIGSGEPIIIPSFLHAYGFDELRTDYEAELAFIIKKTCKNVSGDALEDFVLGYTCMNDVSQRNIQLGDKSGWFRGKSLDTFGPIGPALLLSEDLDNPHDLEITSRVNGKVKQHANTSDMIFGIGDILSFVSRNFTLYEGDIILTGTPAGVGPLHHGDTVEVEIEHIGILSNPVQEER